MLKKIDDAIYAAERGLTVLLIALMASAVFVDVTHRKFSEPVGNLERILGALLPISPEMLQSLPANGSDENRAIVTLEPLLKVNGAVRAAAILILAQLGERQRTLREERKRSEDLQQKLDALKALERSLLGRERKP